MLRELMESTKKRLRSPKDLVLMTDGQRSYESLFASIFAEPYRVGRKGDRGRFPKVRYRIKRSPSLTCSSSSVVKVGGS